MNRRSFLKRAGAGAAAIFASPILGLPGEAEARVEPLTERRYTRGSVERIGDVAFYKDDGSTVLLWDESDDRWEFSTF